jgi:hypothetical protein
MTACIYNIMENCTMKARVIIVWTVLVLCYRFTQVYTNTLHTRGHQKISLSIISSDKHFASLTNITDCTHRT